MNTAHLLIDPSWVTFRQLVPINLRSLSGLPQRNDGGLPQEYFGAVSIELHMGLRPTHRDEKGFSVSSLYD
jgi:hypothetical protein